MKTEQRRELKLVYKISGEIQYLWYVQTYIYDFLFFVLEIPTKHPLFFRWLWCVVLVLFFRHRLHWKFVCGHPSGKTNVSGSTPNSIRNWYVYYISHEIKHTRYNRNKLMISQPTLGVKGLKIRYKSRNYSRAVVGTMFSRIESRYSNE